jgi:hypothetical protein
MRIPVPRPSPALVIATFALGLVLGGTSYATVAAIPRNSVGTPQLKNGAVTAKKLAANAVVSSRVKNGSLLRVDFAPGQLPAGPVGPQGPQGPVGPPGIGSIQRVDVTTPLSSVNSKSLLVNCPSSKKAIGGGARVLGNGASKVSIVANFPDSSGTQWDASASEVVATAQTWQLQAYALCANVAG